MQLRGKFLLLTAISLVAVSACSDTSNESEKTSAPLTQSELDDKYQSPGPHNVGVATRTLENGAEVEIWYPTDVVPTESVTYDVRDFVPDALKSLLKGDVPATFSITATRDADISDGKFPIVLFSHGFSGMRLQSSFLTSHLASYGLVVVAPDHTSRDLRHALVGQVGDQATATTDLLNSLELLLADQDFAEHVDADRVAALGHSAGGGSALSVASDSRIDGYVSMASGNLAESTMPDKPSFFLAGSLDEVVPANTRTLPAYESAPSPSMYWLIDGVGHNGFDDFCTFGNGTGIIGVAEASGLGDLLSAQPQFKKLGEDGCLSPAISADVAFPIIRHAVTAWLLALFEIDTDALDSLTSIETDQYGTNVTVNSK